MPNSGPMKIAARFWAPLSSSPSTYCPSAHTYSPGQGATEENSIRSSRWACCTPDVFQVLEDDAREVLGLAVVPPVLCRVVDEFVVLVDAEDAVGRNALDREGTCDPDGLPVFVGPVIEVLEVGLLGDSTRRFPSASRYARPTTWRAARVGAGSHGSRGESGTSSSVYARWRA